MATLTERFYPLPDRRRTPLSLLGWWESRRWFYNKVVGVTGLFTLAGLSVLLPVRDGFFEPQLLVAVGVYALAANLCYSLGWLSEMLAGMVWGRRAPDMGPMLFREGLKFSIGLTLLPLLVAGFLRIAYTVAQVLG